MNLETKESWEFGLQVMQVLVIPVLLAGVRALNGVRQEVAKTNGRLTRLETWQEAHDKQDDERNDQLHGYIRDVEMRAITIGRDLGHVGARDKGPR